MEEIINKVANSKLEVFDLEDYFPKENIILLDISQWLLDGLVLIEKNYRKELARFDWTQFQGKGIALYCATDAILPAWAFALVTAHLQPYAKQVVQGSSIDYITASYVLTLEKLDYSIFNDKPVILKGCSQKPVPNQVYTLAIQKLQKVAKSIMFGEACSAVPLFKRK